MIPQRTLRNDLAGTEIKERVSECRKRLRLKRVNQRAATAFDDVPNQTFLDAEAVMRESLLSSELSSATSAVGSDHLLLAGETLGVGIT